MALQVRRPEEIISATLARWGFYGENGVGKTTILRSIPSNIPTLVASADDENVKPLRGRPHIQVAKITRWIDLAEILEMFQNPGGSALYKETLKDMMRDPDQKAVLQAAMADPEVKAMRRPIWKALAFDTWTRVQALAINKLVGYDLIAPGQEVQYIERAPKLPKGWDDWQQAGALAGEWMRYFERLPVHVIFLFQEQLYRPKREDDPLQIGPAMTNEALKHVRDTLEIIGRLYVEVSTSEAESTNDPLVGASGAESLRTIHENAKETRKLLIGKHGLYFTKGDSATLGYVVESPTWDKLAVTLH